MLAVAVAKRPKAADGSEKPVISLLLNSHSLNRKRASWCRISNRGLTLPFHRMQASRFPTTEQSYSTDQILIKRFSTDLNQEANLKCVLNQDHVWLLPLSLSSRCISSRLQLTYWDIANTSAISAPFRFLLMVWVTAGNLLLYFL